MFSVTFTSASEPMSVETLMVLACPRKVPSGTSALTAALAVSARRTVTEKLQPLWVPQRSVAVEGRGGGAGAKKLPGGGGENEEGDAGRRSVPAGAGREEGP